MKDGLVITLGHGASVTLIIGGEITNGYQLERLTGIKGDSRFPYRCIEEIEKFHNIPEDIPIYVSHWHPSGHVSQMSDKHWNLKQLKARFPDSIVTSTNTHTTHHDTHAYSAMAYNHKMGKGEHIFVADGFGTLGEVISIYEFDGQFPVLKKRLFGFDGSIGLLYQYATDYVGWKQNQDEWKLNAMANQLEDVEVRHAIRQEAIKHTEKMLDIQMRRSIENPGDPIYNLGALSYTHSEVVKTLDALFEPTDKARIAYFLQNVVTMVVRHWLHLLRIKKCTFVGGCFLNVQLNGELAKDLDEICVMPLSGDEGAGLGIYKYFNNKFIIPDDLCWGFRSLVGTKARTNILYTTTPQAAVRSLLEKNRIVNIIRNTMEFGPRAYCNTSTLALPTEENRAYINKLNNRTTHMPMCPVLNIDQFNLVFEKSNVVRSVEHMIIALPWKEDFKRVYPGVTYTTAEGEVTGRPQVIDTDHWLYNVVDYVGPLINTSFNNHGQPIVYNMGQIVEAHEFMMANDDEKRVTTVVDISGTNKPK